MLIVRIHNTGKGTETHATYDCEVLVTTTPTSLKPIARISGLKHIGGDGWRALLRAVADLADDV